MTRQQLVLADMALNEAFVLSASREALKQLKAYMEKNGKEVLDDEE